MLDFDEDDNIPKKQVFLFSDKNKTRQKRIRKVLILFDSSKSVYLHVLLPDTQLTLTNGLVRYVTTNLKHTLSVFESVVGPLR